MENKLRLSLPSQVLDHFLHGYSQPWESPDPFVVEQGRLGSSFSSQENPASPRTFPVSQFGSVLVPPAPLRPYSHLSLSKPRRNSFRIFRTSSTSMDMSETELLADWSSSLQKRDLPIPRSRAGSVGSSPPGMSWREKRWIRNFPPPP